MRQLHGIHHLTAGTARARDSHDFYIRVLGMRLVKKRSLQTLSPLVLCSPPTGQPHRAAI